MKILYDHQIFEIQRVGGISRGFAEIISHLPEDVQYEISLKESNNLYLDEYSLKNTSSNIVSFNRNDFLRGINFRGKGRLYDFLCNLNLIDSVESKNLRNSQKTLKRGDFDVFHPTYFSDYFLKYLGNKPFVLTVHDLTTENFPQFFSSTEFQTRMRKILVPKANHIIVPSLCTKKDVMSRWNIPEEKISVVHWGARFTPLLPSEQQPFYNFRYILFVGLRDGYKNFDFFISEAAKFLHKYKDINVVCTGQELNDSELSLISSLKLEGRIQTIFATDMELKRIYSNALCLVFPSLSEGFGLPTLEAFQYGCPVLLYNGSCHPEIGGEAAFYFDSDDKSSNISEQLELIEGIDLKERQVIISKGYEQLKKFSWEKASRQYVEIYKSVM